MVEKAKTPRRPRKVKPEPAVEPAVHCAPEAPKSACPLGFHWHHGLGLGALLAVALMCTWGYMVWGPETHAWYKECSDAKGVMLHAYGKDVCLRPEALIQIDLPKPKIF